ncbi:tRNA (adenosine(37)-N6)-threonylcarbamoyltransferase complex ATPase subunit type 1 TsaE [Lactobacillus kullabergensis]|uniref:tRNA (adenosine(37)-N6)-threonylcarbamoyltransferase complex ATPase subunit type 1 TsaE n=1 Tax=Lactobacillus TaxID=1578 RepID=UPI0018DEAE70|nr:MULTISPECIES: tRNA (adenosine(37)-N6)-threonylcarbamoyltransferase complex ATPase subunit type 1 TsaE [Lactobacillus]MBI0121363.1 tRNA (adenosine(37)-N6)-threonylcarbamoyltransferase complex ATPase subunit type 1 TsaE [Lactobacillus sp. M0398]MBI0123510.1 tRNA (adenosine(37)-N6)-threonylcarbamoyltransferase complex ATPase subunit type 1 TsaE [Lactobacillus sp. W8174]MBI0135860.1 tRNA (adenosine(37)-N6)-threonylcarbamoyltransferase complex ATPase subunit type 1 TsaE [Lactobacillus sp. W8173]M
MKLDVNSTQEMQHLGAVIAQTAQAHDLLLLNGDLGAGKTTLTQGIGRELGIKRPVKSPTFTIVREYPEARLPLFHMDFYRLENDDLSSIDLSAYMAEPGLVVIEWPEIVQEQLPEEYLQIIIKRVDDSWNSTKRVVEFVPKGRRNEQWAEKIIEKVS